VQDFHPDHQLIGQISSRLYARAAQADLALKGENALPTIRVTLQIP
jgi:LmbE family N-acetylglucosaminyl deacetylase